jgi:ion channel
MNVFVFCCGCILIALVLFDAFETVILPRRVTRKYRITRLFYGVTWGIWHRLTRLYPWKRRDNLLGFYGPFSLLALLAVWAAGLITGFALVDSGIHFSLNPDWDQNFASYLYLSGSSFFTLGFGDIVAVDRIGHIITVLEAGMGFGFLAMVLGYLPVLYQAFSKRESVISLLDARAGSPPTAGELLRRVTSENDFESLRQLFYEWERSAAEIMESHLSYPVLAYFRSQHDNQNWVAALTAILDASALSVLTSTGRCQQQSRLTFAMARHAVVDLAQVFGARPRMDHLERLTETQMKWLEDVLPKFSAGPVPPEKLREDLGKLRALYEPYAIALANHLLLTLPTWTPILKKSDNWQTSAWERMATGALPMDEAPEDEHD